MEECATKFEEFCEQAFTLRKGMNIPGINLLVSNYNHSKYETQPLQQALIDAFTDEQYLFGGRQAHPTCANIKVAVTATSTVGHPVVLANYNRLCTEKRKPRLQGRIISRP